MTSSDYIAIAALAVTLIVTLANLVANYLTNLSNNKAKLREIAFSKQAEAFQLVFEALHNLTDAKLLLLQTEEHKLEYVDALAGFRKTYNKYRVYLPTDVDITVLAYFNNTEFFKKGDLKSEDQIDRLLTQLTTHTEQVKEEMQKILGYS